MTYRRLIAAIALVGMTTPAIAETASVGSLTQATAGSLVMRDGKLIPAVSGQSLFAGDRVMTFRGSSARLALSGCKIALPSASTMSVGSGCGAPSTLNADFAGEDPDKGDTGAAVVDDAGMTFTGIVVATLAVAAAVAGVVIAVDDASN